LRKIKCGPHLWVFLKDILPPDQQVLDGAASPIFIDSICEFWNATSAQEQKREDSNSLCPNEVDPVGLIATTTYPWLAKTKAHVAQTLAQPL
jgi:hypothetical protein